jgi:hypothetical protein
LIEVPAFEQLFNVYEPWHVSIIAAPVGVCTRDSPQCGLVKAMGIAGPSAGGEGSNGPRNPFNYRLDYGPLGLDRRLNFVASALTAHRTLSMA